MRGKTGEARITCRGWFSTLEWQYYENLSGFEGYTVTGQGGREVGEDDRPILAMSFQIGAASAWTASTLWLHIWRQGSNTPIDNLEVSLRANNAGEPGAILATSSIVGSEVPTRSEWVEFTLSTPVTLEPATTYFIYMARSGAIDANAYYMIDTNLNNGYERGYPIYYNTNVSAWVSAAHKGDVLFKLVGGLDTTDQITTLVESCGQFYEDTIVEDASGIETIQYRNGDSTGLYEMEKLLQSGTTNGRRLLAETTPSRYLRIYEEAAKPTNPKNCYGLDADGLLYFQSGAPVDLTQCPVGMWCHLVDVIPATVDLSVISDPSLFFVDCAEYDVQKGQYTIKKTREQGDPLDQGGVEQG
jgi:TPR repeat protein